MLLGGEVVFEALAGRTAIDVLRRQIYKVLLAEAALRLRARRQRLRQRHRDVGLVTGEDLRAVEAGAISDGIERLCLRRDAKASKATQPGIGNPLLLGPNGDDRRAWDQQRCKASSKSTQVASRGVRGMIATFFRSGLANVDVVRAQYPLEMKEGPSGSAIRSLVPSHRERLWSKAMVVSVAEKRGIAEEPGHADEEFSKQRIEFSPRSLLITANQPFGEWGKVFSDQAMTLAAIDRLVHHARIQEMNVEISPESGASASVANKFLITHNSPPTLAGGMASAVCALRPSRGGGSWPGDRSGG